MDNLQKAIKNLTLMKAEIKSNAIEIRQIRRSTMRTLDTAISAMQELQQYKERLKQLRHAEVLSFQCKLPDGRICHFSDFLDFWRMDTWSDGGKVTDWEQEAKRQCSAAGELRIQLGERLEEIRTRISAMRQMLHAEDNTMDQAILTWKISQMEEQAAWLESVLYSKRSGAGQAVDEVGQAPEGKEP